ncbi:outer membrane protein [Pelagibacterium montanilacus]|uniref:outer membrane protein n=1 Tax=Pelagibacterium montanilacus TaxID=2185280 RepID=UPI001FE5C24E|nr:outer membrane protein [Pelagibacterium montanilacus]
MRYSPFHLTPMVIVLAATGAVQAADPILPIPAPAPQMLAPTPVHDWSGAYLGGVAGFGAGEATFVDGDGDAVGDQSLFDDLSGFSGGVTAGYAFQTGALVFGLEGDILIGGPSQTEEITGDTEGEITYGLDYHGSLRGRVGYAFDGVLPYLTGGLAFGGGTFDEDLTGEGGDIDESYSGSHLGWTAGAGVEVMATDQISLKGEYLYTDLGPADYVSDPDGGFDVTFHSIRAGVNFRF